MGLYFKLYILLVYTFCICGTFATNHNLDLAKNKKPNEPYYLFLSSPAVKDCSLLQIISHAQCIIITGENPTETKSSNYYKVYHVKDYYNTDEVTLAALHTFKDQPFGRIIIRSESDILRAAYLREYLKIPGQNVESALAFRDKIRMKEILLKKGIKVPPFRKLNTIIDLQDFVERYGYPAIVKPIRGYGAGNTFILRNEDCLKKLATKPDIFNEFVLGNYEVESFVEGEMYHIDGLIYKGKIIFSWPSIYTNTCLEMNQQDNPLGKGYTASCLLPSDDPCVKDIKAYTERVLAALPTPENTAFFLEFFKDKNGDFIFCEVGSRVGGVPNPQVFFHAIGINLVEEFQKLQADLHPSFDNQKLTPKEIIGGITVSYQPGVFLGFQNKKSFSWVMEKDITLEKGKRYEMPQGVISSAGYFIIKANSIVEFAARADQLAQYFFSSSHWSK